MKKTCRQTVRISRADNGMGRSLCLSVRNRPFGTDGYDTGKRVHGDGKEGVFWLNRLYGESFLHPLLVFLQSGEAGSAGLSVAERLKAETRRRSGSVKGEILWEILQNGLGMTVAARLIAGLDGIGALGLYGDRIVARFVSRRGKRAGFWPVCRRQPAGISGDNRREIREAVHGCRRHIAEKEGETG